MALTRAHVESELVLRAGRLLAVVGLDGATVDGTNLTLNGPLRAGLESLAIPPVAWTVTDTDLAAVDPGDVSQLLDVAELRTLQNVLGNMDEPDQQNGQDQQQWGAMAQRVQKTVTELADRCAKRYGLYAPSLAIGVIEMDFNEPQPPSGLTP